MKIRIIHNESDINELRQSIEIAASLALDSIADLRKTGDMQAFWSMKFKTIGFDPIDEASRLNLIEQLNQSFTYLATIKALQVLFSRHPDLAPFTVNLGTAPGSDIESSRDGGLAAEVFAAVTLSNNQKLKKDLAKVGATGARHRYVFFMSPDYKQGRQLTLETEPGVKVWSVGER